MSTSHRGLSGDEITGSQMLTGMIRLRGALQAAALPLDLAGRRRRCVSTARRSSTSSRTT